MSFMAVLVMPMLGLLPAEGMSRQQLVQLIDAAQAANCLDVSFDYEGCQVNRGETSKDAKGLNYTGSFAHRADGATLVDLYQLATSTTMATHAIVGFLNGITEFSSQPADRTEAKITIKKQGPLEYAGPTSYRRIWLADMVKNLAESDYLYEYEGSRRLDGQECAVVRFRLVYNETTPKDETISYIFWIDLNRGGHVLRFEQRHSGESLGTLTTVRLEAFPRGHGKRAWLPVSGRDENWMDVKNQQIVFLKEPLSYTTYDMIPVTLRLDRGLKDEDFAVKAKRGDVVGDEIRKARYEFGQYMVASLVKPRLLADAEVKSEMDRMLKDSAVMARELKASSPLRDGPGVLSYWPWAVASLASLWAGYIFYKNRTPGRR